MTNMKLVEIGFTLVMIGSIIAICGIIIDILTVGHTALDASLPCILVAPICVNIIARKRRRQRKSKHKTSG